MIPAVMLLGACPAEPAIRAIEPPACASLVGKAWDDRFIEPGIAGSFANAKALVRLPDGRFVLAGRFEQVVGLVAQNIAVWDGARWDRLGDGLPGTVTGLAVDDLGALWAIGTAGERGSDYVARWDGVAWHMLADGIDGIAGITAIDGAIAVWGWFDTFAGIEKRGIAIFDGGWSMIEIEARVVTATRQPGGLCIGGSIRLDRPAGAACWDGSAWTALGDNHDVLALARAADGRWWAQIADALAVLAPDNTWQTVAPLRDADGFFPAPRLRAIHVGVDDSILVAGRFIGVGDPSVTATGLARWTAAAGWTAVGRGVVGGYIEAVVVDGDRLHVAGDFIAVGGIAARGVATITPDAPATPWLDRPALSPGGAIEAIVETAGGIAIAGTFVVADNVVSSVSSFEDTWTLLRAAPPFWERARLAVLPDDSLVRSGSYLERWDGSAWSRLDDRPTEGGPVFVDAEGALYFTHRDDAGIHTSRLRNGERESFVPVASPIHALLAFDGELVAVEELDENDFHLIAHRGSQWQEIPGSRGPRFQAVVSPVLGLVVASSFGVSAWDGTSWHAIDPRRATALAACSDGIVAAFDDAEIGAPPATTTLAFRDATRWHPLTGEPGRLVHILTPTSTGLYVGSYTPAPALRRWR